jgi:hypothetical protein
MPANCCVPPVGERPRISVHIPSDCHNTNTLSAQQYQPPSPATVNPGASQPHTCTSDHSRWSLPAASTSLQTCLLLSRCAHGSCRTGPNLEQSPLTAHMRTRLIKQPGDTPAAPGRPVSAFTTSSAGPAAAAAATRRMAQNEIYPQHCQIHRLAVSCAYEHLCCSQRCRPQTQASVSKQGRLFKKGLHTHLCTTVPS